MYVIAEGVWHHLVHAILRIDYIHNFIMITYATKVANTFRLRRITYTPTVRFSFLPKLNAGILNELIEKIVVSEKEIINGEKYQCVHIYYKFVGVMSI